MISLEFRITDMNSESPRPVHNRCGSQLEPLYVEIRTGKGVAPQQMQLIGSRRSGKKKNALRFGTIVSKRMPRHHSECPSLVTKIHPTKT